MAASYIHGITHHERVWDKVERAKPISGIAARRSAFLNCLFISHHFQVSESLFDCLFNR